MSISEIKPGLSKSNGESNAIFTPAQVRNYRDALLSLGVDEDSAEKHARYLEDPVAREERCVGPNCRIDTDAVKGAVRTAFGNGKPTTPTSRPR